MDSRASKPRNMCRLEQHQLGRPPPQASIADRSVERYHFTLMLINKKSGAN